MKEITIVNLASVGIMVNEKNGVGFKDFEPDFNSEVSLKNISKVTIDKAHFGIEKKMLFWLQRILTWNKHFHQSRFDYETEYRYWYEIEINFKSSNIIRKKIRNIDLIGVNRAIDELNKCLKVEK